MLGVTVLCNCSWCVIRVYERLFLVAVDQGRVETIWHVVFVFEVVFCDAVYESAVKYNAKSREDEKDRNRDRHCDETTPQEYIHDGIGDVSTAVKSTQLCATECGGK